MYTKTTVIDLSVHKEYDSSKGHKGQAMSKDGASESQFKEDLSDYFSRAYGQERIVIASCGMPKAVAIRVQGLERLAGQAGRAATLLPLTSGLDCPII